MHEHDLDLIAALADGSLADEAQARALVETCPICRSELRSQTEVLEWLATAPGVEMKELEKAALHRDLWTELRGQPSKASTPWWQPWSYVAAGLLVTLGLVGVLNGGLLSNGEETAMLRVTSDLDDAGDEGLPFLAEDSGAGGDAESGAATTTAAAEEALPFPELADEARAAQQADPRAGAMGVDEAVDDCLSRIGLDDHIVVEEVELDQTYLVVMAEDTKADRSVTFVTLTDCEIVYVDR